MNNLLVLVVILFVSVFLQSITKFPASQFWKNIIKRKKIKKLYTILEVEILISKCEKYNHECLTTARLTDWLYSHYSQATIP